METAAYYTYFKYMRSNSLIAIVAFYSRFTIIFQFLCNIFQCSIQGPIFHSTTKYVAAEAGFEAIVSE